MNRIHIRKVIGILIMVSVLGCGVEDRDDPNLLERLMKSRADQFGRILDYRDSLEVQIIYTMIDRDASNTPSFQTFYFNVDADRYFYPASTVKLPMALLALEKINKLAIPGLDKFTPMLSDSLYEGQVSVVKDSTSENGLPSIAHYIKKILVVSDNDAYNRLYEFMGQKESNAIMNSKGYQVRFLHRLERFLSPDQNRHTEGVRFMQGDSVIYEQPMLFNEDSIQAPKLVLKGKGYQWDDSIIYRPFDFTYKNFYSLVDQQAVLRALLFPRSVDSSSLFDLTDADYQFVYQYMSQLPTETINPNYSSDPSYNDAYCKFILYGAERKPIPSSIRIFNKVGDAYGYLIDNAYIVDFENGVEFMLSAVINTNTDGIFNDGIYEYETLGYPFMKNLGELIYDYELHRKRSNKPDLSRFVFSYDVKKKQ